MKSIVGWLHRNSIYLLIGCLLGGITGWVIGAVQSYYQQWGDLNSVQRFVFTIDDKVSDWNHVTFQLSFQQAKEQSLLHDKVTRSAITQARTSLLTVLDQAKQRYGDASTRQAILTYEQWLAIAPKQLFKITDQQSRLKWSMANSEQQDKLYDALRQRVGFYNIDNIQQARIMLKVPKAEAALKAHPNDKKRCTVMKRYPTDDINLSAKQIAFLRLGAKYCDHYYHQPSAWGMVESKPITMNKDYCSIKHHHGQKVDNVNSEKEKYIQQLPYAVYYQQYILPALKQLEKTKHISWTRLCITQGINATERDPDDDAYRVLWRRGYQQHCKQQQPPDFYRTALWCIQQTSVMCEHGGNPRGCDVFERCKLTTGVLFS